MSTRATRLISIVVGDRRDGPLFGFQHFDGNAGAIRQQRAAPSARTKGGNRRQRHQRRVQRQDGPVRREIIGGRAGRRRKQHAIGDEFAEPLLAVDADAQFRGLIGLPQQRNFVDRPGRPCRAFGVDRAHDERMNDREARVFQSLAQAAIMEFVHQEADGAAIHAVDRLGRVHHAMQRLQHQAVAAQGDDHVGLRGLAIAIALDKPLQRLVGFLGSRRQETDRLRASRSACCARPLAILFPCPPRVMDGRACVKFPGPGQWVDRSCAGGPDMAAALDQKHEQAAGQDDRRADQDVARRQIAEDRPAPKNRPGERRIFKRRQRRRRRAAQAFEQKDIGRRCRRDRGRRSIRG